MLKTTQKRKFNPQENFSKKHFNTTDIYKIFFAAGEEAKLNGTSEMTLEEINAEIAELRRESATKALEAMREMQRISELNGNSEMTLEEINAEIAAARREREEREARQA